MDSSTIIHRFIFTKGQAEIPDWSKPFLGKIPACHIINPPPIQVKMKEYIPGHWMRPHLDNIHHFESAVASISLVCCAVIGFTKLSKIVGKDSFQKNPTTAFCFFVLPDFVK